MRPVKWWVVPFRWLRKAIRRAGWVFWQQHLTEEQKLAAKRAEENARLSRVRRELVAVVNTARARGVNLPPPEEWIGW